MAGIDGNGDRSDSGNGRLEGGFGASSDINVLADGTAGRGSAVTASAITSGVRVLSLDRDEKWKLTEASVSRPPFLMT